MRLCQPLDLRCRDALLRVLAHENATERRQQFSNGAPISLQ
jgi:hypothetical protein